MLIYWRRNNIEFETDVEDWMADQEFTEVFDYRAGPVTEAEQEITRILDRLLHLVMFRRTGIDDMVRELQKRQAKMVHRKKLGPGEASMQEMVGTAVDAVFKRYFERLRMKEFFQPYRDLITRITPPGVEGVDVESTELNTAWDVTSAGEAWKHVKRDCMAIGKKGGKLRFRKNTFGRYYLLVWDEPRMNQTAKVEAIARGRTHLGGAARDE